LFEGYTVNFHYPISDRPRSLAVLTKEIVLSNKEKSTTFLSGRFTFMATRAFEIINVVIYMLDTFTISIDYF
jgi:hypothetical protein